MRFITTTSTTKAFQGAATLRVWRVAARAQGCTPNLAYMQSRFRSSYVDPYRVSSVFDLVATDPRRRKRAIKKQVKLIERIKRFLLSGSMSGATFARSLSSRWDGEKLIEVSIGGVG